MLNRPNPFVLLSGLTKQKTHKMYRLLFILILPLFCLACQQEEIITDCETITGCEILPEREKEKTCIYSEVYRYEGTIYTIYNCCLCDLIYMAIDCNGDWLCELEDNCMEEFDEKAEYLYSVVKE